VLNEDSCDLLIVGGGINGAAAANLAAERGKKVILVEKQDFASGTSSKSSKLVHGGIRYLEQFHLGLVREALHERHLHIQEVPHLVKPLKFLIPVYRGDRRPLWVMKLGVTLYDFLAGKKNIAKHESLSARAMLAAEPELERAGLSGGVAYYDAQMDDARLCLENVLSAVCKGAVASNYTEVVEWIWEGERVVGAKLRDGLCSTAGLKEVRAAKVICAVGPWTNRVMGLEQPGSDAKVRTTKGMHLVYEDVLTKHALLIPTRRDNRIFFVIPWRGHTLIGTTDTDFDGDPDKVEATAEDVAYLIEETQRVFPKFKFDQSKVVATFAGLRPLIMHGGNPSSVSREHSIFQSKGGVIYISGGKYTTYRKIAQDCLKKVFGWRFKENAYPLYGSGIDSISPEAAARQFSLDQGLVEQLRDKYGVRYVDVLKRIETDPSEGEVLCAHLPVIRAQLGYAVTVEKARTLEDVLDRRLGMIYHPCGKTQCGKRVRQVLSEMGLPSINNKRNGECA